MPVIAVLPRESTNRVYGRVAPDLLAAELAALAPAMAADVGEIDVRRLGGVDYTCAELAGATSADRFVLSNLSATRALFELTDEHHLIPIEVAPLAYFDDDLVSIQRYPGKTNEQFTHLLVNLTVAASSAAQRRARDGDRVRLLDPVAGRGTTLNRALVLGFDAIGVEVAERDVDEYRTFLTTYLQDHRVKHRKEKARVRKGPLAGTSSFTVTVRGHQEVHVVAGDTARTAELLAGRKADVVVADLPYGVQHRAGAAASRHRSPEELLIEALPGWRRVLAGGGAIGLAWNLRTLARARLCEVLAEAGFDVVEHPRSFEHVVDRSITRDVVVATR